MVDFKKGIPTPKLRKSGYDFSTIDGYINFFHSKSKGLKTIFVSEILEKIEKKDKDFSNLRMVGIDWRGRDLSGFDFSESKIEWNIFTGCKLVNANFSRTYIDFCIFERADLTDADFRHSVLWDSILENATINNADFSDSDIRYVDFINCNLGAAKFNNTIKFKFFTSWDEAAGENFDTGVALKLLGTLNIPRSKVLLFKTVLEGVVTKAKSFKAVYMTGSSFANPHGDLYDPKTDRTKSMVDSYFPKPGSYADTETTYLSGQYGKEKVKRDKKTTYKK